MFDSKSPVIKIGGYIIVGFFVLIIIISFGMPDFMSRIGLDKSTVAVVNGEKIHYLDFLRFRDNVASRVKDVNSKEIQQLILDSMIRYRLQLQKADKIGIMVSDDRVKRTIRENPMFFDQSGKFSNRNLKLFLDHYHLNLTDYYVTVKEELLNGGMAQMLQMGTGVSPDEVIAQSAIENSKIQIKYCFASNAELKKKIAADLSVSDAEIDEELRTDRAEVKDPKTDRERVRGKLADRKFEMLKKHMVDDIDKLSLGNASFEAAVARIGGAVKMSSVFKIGEPVKENDAKGSVLFSISESPVFINDCLTLGIGRTSRVISSFDGLYVFTPVKKDVVLKGPADAEYAAVENRLLTDKANSLYVAMMMQFVEKSKIKKNLSFD